MSLLYAVVLVIVLWLVDNLFRTENMTNTQPDTELELDLDDVEPHNKPASKKLKVHFANPIVDNIGSGYRNSEYANADHSNNEVSLNHSIYSNYNTMQSTDLTGENPDSDIVTYYQSNGNTHDYDNL
jgi:hypothetical protein